MNAVNSWDKLQAAMAASYERRKEEGRKAATPEMAQNAKQWIARVGAAVAEIEAAMKAKSIPVLRGSFRGDGGVAIVHVEALDAGTLDIVPNGESLCVLDLQQPDYPLADSSDVQDMHVYLRIGHANTWVHYCLESPEDGPSDNDEDDESDWSFQQRMLTIDAKKLNEFAMKIASAPGFGSLRNRAERQDFSNEAFREDADTELTDYDVWQIAKTAESIFALGIAPALAKALEKEGKSKNEIARALGLSKVRVERALSTTTPPHIAKLL